MSLWTRLHAGHRRYRWPLKLAAFGVLVLLVLYPKIWLIPVTIQRVADLDALLEPQNPGLAPLEAEVRADLPENLGPKQTLEAVQKVVYKHVPYSHDWDTWGVMEYLPTTAEVLEKGREDCDGRAVLAASLLRRMGVDAWLVTDLLHMWVQTPEGETMSPTGGDKTLASSRIGDEAAPTKTNITWGLVKNLARGLSYGVAVFPLGRELIILVGLCLLTMHPQSSFWRRAAGCLLLWVALDALRHAGEQAATKGGWVDVAISLVAAVLVIAGWLTLAIKDRAPQPDSAATHPE